MDKTAERQVSINIRVDGTWHRAFELVEQGERHVMAWEGCPLNEVDTINVEYLDREPMILETAGPAKVCEFCYAEELKELR